MIKIDAKPLWYNRQLWNVTAIVKLEVDSEDAFKVERPILYLGKGERLGLLDCRSEELAQLKKHDVKAVSFVSLRPVKDQIYGNRFVPYECQTQLEEGALSRALGKIFPIEEES